MKRVLLRISSDVDMAGVVKVLSCPILIGGSKPFHDSAASNVASVHLENIDAAVIWAKNSSNNCFLWLFFDLQLS